MNEIDQLNEQAAATIGRLQEQLSEANAAHTAALDAGRREYARRVRAEAERDALKDALEELLMRCRWLVDVLREKGIVPPEIPNLIKDYDGHPVNNGDQAGNQGN